MSSPRRSRRGSLRRLLLVGTAAAALIVRPTSGSTGEAVIDAVGGDASGSAAGSAPVDIVALRALLRTGSGQGDFVHIPEAGQVVFLHVAFRVDGPGALVDVSLRATIDGEEFCGVDAPVATNAEFTGRCTNGWTATPGLHTLAWQLDVEVEEANRDNNAVSRTWSTGSPLDARADRVFWRTAPGSGVDVPAPAIGQNVYAHLAWTFVGPGSDLDVFLHATIDGAALCGGTFSAVSGNDYTLWCEDPWVATAGAHTLRWELDILDRLAEGDESNNAAAADFVVAGPSPTPEETASLTPTRTATRTPTTMSGPPVSPSASRTPGIAEIRAAYGRGDANCNFNRSAADVVAQSISAAGATVCGNDDCDRDGAVTEADRLCAAECLFGLCPVPSHAPQVTSVRPESASEILPLSLVRVAGERLQSAGLLTTVQVGGTRSEFVDVDDAGDLIVLVPYLEAGAAELVVFVGDVASAPFPLVVVAPGAGAAAASGGIAEALALADEVVALLLAADLSALFHDEHIPLVQSAGTRFREALAALDPDAVFPPDRRPEVDRVVNASGVIELARRVRDALQGGGAATVAPPLTPTLLRDVTLLAGFAGEAATRIALVAGRGTLAVLALKGAAATAAFVGVLYLLKTAVDVTAPVITAEPEYEDSLGRERLFPTAGGLARIYGYRLFQSTTTLVVQTAFLKNVEIAASGTCGSGCLEYPLPDVSGFCGPVTFRLETVVIDSKQAVPAAVQPVVLNAALPPSSHLLVVGASGVLPATPPCDTEVLFEGPAPSTQVRPARLRARIREDGRFLEVAPRVRAELADVALLLTPGEYVPRLVVADVTSDDAVTFVRENNIADIDIVCTLPQLALKPGAPSEARCYAVPLKADQFETDFPEMTIVRLQSSSNTIMVPSGFDPNDLEYQDKGIVVSSSRRGTATLTAEAESAGRFLARSKAGVTFVVRDATAPQVRIISHDCRDFIPVAPGSTVEIRTQATDNDNLDHIRLDADGDAVENPQQQHLCTPGLTCDATFDLAFRTTGFVEREVFAVVEAADVEGNIHKAQCSFRVEGGPPTPTTRPTSTPTSTPPTPGGTVPIPLEATIEKIADSTLEVPAHNATFHGFRDPAVKDGVVVFIGDFSEGFNISDTHGIFVWDGAEVELVADNVTLVPGTAERFRTYTGVSFDGEEVIFSGNAVLDDPDLFRIALGDDPETGARLVLSFTSLELPIFTFSARNGFVGGQAHCTSALCQASPLGLRDLVYTASLAGGTDSFDIAARNGDPVPGRNATFTSASALSFDFAADGPAVTFSGRGSDGQDGIYRVVRGGQPVRIADRNTRAPERQLNFRGFGTPAIAGAEVAFGAFVDSASVMRGIYATRSGALVKVADPNTPAPGSQGTFVEFNRFALVGYDEGVIVFTSTTPAGVFAEVDGVLTRVLGVGDKIGDKVVNFVAGGGDDGIDGTEIPLVVGFEGGSIGLYLATLERPLR